MFKKVKDILLNNYLKIISFLCLIGFLALAEDVFNHDIMKGDIIGYNLVSKYLICDFLTPIMKVITWFGSASCIVLISVIILVVFRNKKESVFVSLNLLMVYFLNHILKYILHRPRPTGYRIVNAGGYSFPSGHSMISMAFYGYLIYLIYKNVKNKYIKYSLMSFLSILIIMIGISRIYLGVHYTSDVCAGFLISISYLIVFIGITNDPGKFRRKKKKV